VLRNNQLDDFTAASGASNAFGHIGYEANLPGPGKRPLSSMSPTIVLKDDKPVLVTGSPGGSRIISTVLQVIVNVLDYHMDVAAAVAAPRLRHQWLSDEVRVERGFAEDAFAGLKARGHRVIEPMDRPRPIRSPSRTTNCWARPIRAPAAPKLRGNRFLWRIASGRHRSRI
jgi:gamma-glutamyltranspeptidase/glutathione hydrolase